MSEQAKSVPPGLLLSDDLIFASRIAGAALALGLEVRQVRAPDLLVETTRRQQARCVIVDIAFPDLDLPELMRLLREAGAPRVVAYGPHVDAESLRAARAAGCDPVLPRSKFVEDLPRELAGWLTGASPKPDPADSVEQRLAAKRLGE